MRSIVLERCKRVVDHWNTILCRNYKNFYFKLNKTEDGFKVYLYVKPYRKKLIICEVEEILYNPALVEIFVDEPLFCELGLDREFDTTMICDSSLLHLILQNIFSTQYVNALVYAQVREMIFSE